MSEAIIDEMKNLIGHLAGSLAIIAAGRNDCGRPLGGSVAQDVARSCLFKISASWTKGAVVPTPGGRMDMVLAGKPRAATDALIDGLKAIGVDE